ncbi:MAG: PGPGW domain-containing protein [Actinomycetes bacterium]
MSAGSEDSPILPARPRHTEVMTGAPAAGSDSPHGSTAYTHTSAAPPEDARSETVLLEPHEDRWHWRRRIRRDPRKLFFYRIAVGVVGLLFVVLGFATGWLPGPGGIPLVLLGLAILASEFEWAHRPVQWFKRQLHRYSGWSRPQQVMFWVLFFAACGTVGYLYMFALGIPGWLPAPADNLLQKLPGLP